MGSGDFTIFIMKIPRHAFIHTLLIQQILQQR